MQFSKLDDLRALCRGLPDGDLHASEAAARRQQVLTKPPGSLGRLEQLAIWLAHWQGREHPRLDHVTIAVFAGNHGVAARGVSAYPAEVTAQMVKNFSAGGAAINQIAALAGAELKVDRSRSSSRHAIHGRGRDGRGRIPASDRARLSQRTRHVRPAGGRRNGHRQHHGGSGAVRGLARRRRALGRARHRRRQQGLAESATAIEAALQLHHQRSAIPSRSRHDGRTGTRGNRRGRARGAAAENSGAARRICRDRCRLAAVAGRRKRARPLPRRACLGRGRLALARGAGTRSAARSRHAARRSFGCGRRDMLLRAAWPATMAWQPLPRRAFPTRRPRALSVITGSWD